MPEPVLMIVSIDTEEDNWYRSRQSVTCSNILELRRQAEFFNRLGVRPTYFTSYQVANAPGAADVMREVGARGEIAAHLHPWNTPPLTEAFTPRNSMLKNLPAGLQLEKLQVLTAELDQVFGVQPRSFRAGRYGLGEGSVAALLHCGYRVDSSVTPFVSWKEFDDGPSFDGAPLDVYRLAPDHDVNVPAPDGEIIEVPLSAGFSRGPFEVWGRMRQPLLKRVAARAGICKRIMLSPEMASAGDMLTLSQRLLERGVRHLHLTWHSPSLKPGLGPFTAVASDVERLYASVENYLDRLSRRVSLRFVTVTEAATLLTTTAQPEAAAC